jgi:ferric-dicitrate binding protein FerR (iron transport regulator)
MKGCDFLNNDKFIKWRLLQTIELDQYWAQYIADHPEHADELNLSISKFDAVNLNLKELSEENKNELYKKILGSISVYEGKRKKRKYYWLSAAAACFALIMVLSYHFMLNSGITSTLSSSTIVGKALPSEYIRLIIGNKVVGLQQNSQIRLTQGGLASVNIGSGKSAMKLNLSKSAMNKLIVPPGRRSSILLADGTKVWLNSGTQLEFPAEFIGNTRDINVKGEIYIEVAKSKERPFIVHANGFNVKVYGTKFNVSAYSDDVEESVVLVEGSVKVETNNHKSISLTPNEMFLLNADKLTKKNVDASEFISWTRGVLTFNQTPISDILKKIGRYYNVSFDCNRNVKFADKTCSGKLFLSDDLDNVMTSISELSSTSYLRKGDIVYLKREK